MPSLPASLLAVLCALQPGLESAPPSVERSATVIPSAVELKGSASGVQLVVSTARDSRHVDLTRDAQFSVVSGSTPIAEIDSRGRVRPLVDGQGELLVTVDGTEWRLPLTVSGISLPTPPDFERDIQPIMTRFACNSGPCHGKQRGQNGFQLSLLGFDSDFDHDALTKEGRGRRTFAAVPSASLLLQKPAGDLPHGGGQRIEKSSPAYRLLEQWLETGAPRRIANTPAVTGIIVEPTEAILSRRDQHQLRVTALFNDGSREDVTHWSSFQSSEAPVADVDEWGLITAGSILGDTAIMARYQGHIAVCAVLVPHPEPAAADAYSALPEHNFIDGLVWKRIRKLGVTPSAPAAEHTVLRRLYLDIIGRGPTADEARRYLEDNAPDKRARLVDQLLEDPEYAEHAASKWTDLLRPNPYHVGIKATLNYDQWIREAFRRNMPYDQFVRELITAQGSTFHNGAVTLYRDRRAPDEITTLVSQLFLGIRLECAKCHHHPFEVYGQDDFYSFAAYFARMGRKGVGISAPISGSEEFVFVAEKGAVTHPLTGAVMTPRPLYGDAPEVTESDDPREILANWIANDSNPYFAKTIANRVWADFMSRGLVEPVDDLRGTNPPSNPELLEALASELRTHGYDLKQLIRVIANSYVYGLSSLPSAHNAADHRNFSRHYRQRLRAEVLYDTLSQITGESEDFDAMPPKSRAKEIWTARVDSLFLDAFGRQDPNQNPPCERNVEPTVVQALHLMNSNQLYRRVTGNDGQAARLAGSDRDNAAVVDELYLCIYGRFPTAEERATALQLFPAEVAQRRAAVEDIMWALINTPEFVFED